MSLRSPLGRALGHGAAGHGADHWWNQRVSAMALAPLGLWFLFSLLALPDFGHATVSAWLGRPMTATLALLLVGTLAYHSSLGVQVIIEDYVHAKVPRVAALVIARFAHVLAAAAGVVGVLATAFGARA